MIIGSRPTWEEYALALASTAATRAACTRRQVGAAILDRFTMRVIALGYNGTPAGEVNCTDGGCPRGQLSYEECPALGDYSNCRGRHAEVNAIDHALSMISYLGDCFIAITREPCDGCRAAIIEYGLDHAIWYKPGVELEIEHWYPRG